MVQILKAYIVLFRGVGGATQLPTKPLKEALTAAGFKQVATYINSGNAVLATELGEKATTEKIAAICGEKFGFDKDIMLVARAAWKRLVENNPFPESVDVPTSVHAFALGAEPALQAVEALKARAAEHERVVVTGKVLYFHAPKGFGTSKLPPVIDRTLGVVSTARNWRTVLALMEMADAIA
jgi:uncharacterized protein (DUF1697 family)